MRILSRPMFRYGGPIKEGVMHGMRDGGRTIAGGNQIGTPMGNRTGFKNPLSWKSQIATKIPAVGNIYKKGLANWGNILNKAKGMFGTTTPVRHIPVTRVPGGTVKNTWGINTTTQPSWKAGKEVTENIFTPNWLGRTSEAQLAQKLWQGKGFIGKPIKAGAQFLYRTPTASIPLVYFGGKWLLKDGTPAPDQDKINKQVTGGAKTSRWDDTAPELTASQRTKLAKDQQNARMKSYLDMMGYDSAKKTAMSDALIDASALVQDATTEAGSIKKADWGNLINKAIQTTSKRLDKPAQIREAVGLMSVKAAIQKDLEDPQVKAHRELQMKKLEKELEGNSFAENKILTAKNAPGQAGYDLAVEITQGKDFKGNLVDSTEWIESLEKMKDDDASKGLNEKQLIEKYTNKLIEGKGYEDGHYTIGDNLVTIKDSLVIDVE